MPDITTDETAGPQNSHAVEDILDQTLADDTAEDVLLTDDEDQEEIGDDPAALRRRLAEANARAHSEHESFLRARADFSNFKRRNDEEKERLRTIMTEDVLKGLLPIVDNFERAVQAAQSTQDYDKLVGGVSATLRQVQEFLVRQGIETISADQGEPFDPNFHNAVLREETTEYAENTIVEELQKGYTLGGRVLRPSMVKVATGDA